MGDIGFFQTAKNTSYIRSAKKMMAGCFCCFRCCDPNSLRSGHVRLEDLPKVCLDTSRMGQDVVVVKSGKRICGSGAALANTPLQQNKSYFEVKLQSTGIWGLGLASRKCGLNSVPLGGDTESWVLRHDCGVYHNNEQRASLQTRPEEGDILGVSFDHIELRFYLNGQEMISVHGIKGTVYPVFYVDDGATMDVQFQGFYHTPPEGYEEIMIEKSLL